MTIDKTTISVVSGSFTPGSTMTVEVSQTNTGPQSDDLWTVLVGEFGTENVFNFYRPEIPSLDGGFGTDSDTFDFVIPQDYTGALTVAIYHKQSPEAYDMFVAGGETELSVVRQIGKVNQTNGKSVVNNENIKLVLAVSGIGVLSHFARQRLTKR
jgi:hypothetical protein